MKSFAGCLVLLLGGALMFAASFPNPVFTQGLPFLAWVAYAPVFWVIRRVGTGPLVLLGAFYGYLSYFFFAPWLGAFHPLGGIFACSLQLFYMALLFPLLKWALILYPRRGYLLQWLMWLSYEYLRTKGFLGFPYGITGYTQWQILPLIQIASITGVWGVSALVLFPSAYLAGVLEGPEGAAGESLARKNAAGAARRGFRREIVPALAWGAALAGTLIFGLVSPADYAAAPAAHVALIQQNADPWKADTPGQSRRILAALTGLSRNALAAEPGTDLVVWPETAFVPRIFWHLNYRDEAESYELVKELLDFLAPQGVPFLIGNDDGRLEATPQGRWDRVDYNGALLFRGAEISGVYRKMHLVPFAEYFPYERIFPRLYRALAGTGTQFWTPGREAVVFDTGKIRFSSPICFEDTFGYISRDFTRNGAELIVNLSNDGWAESLSCQMQHLSMAVFRAVENRRSLVRSTTTGQTCAIDPSGRILAMAEPFTPAFLTVRVPLLTNISPYTRWGDIWGILFLFCAVLLLLIGVIPVILRSIKTGRNT
ncbi:MAG: apolipoprotein N-acyltransferase [Spirochaetaceae bacterium]|nr:apolipoprotein N-acyltransferase [Spirochaetaceae bacterium]